LTARLARDKVTHTHSHAKGGTMNTIRQLSWTTPNIGVGMLCVGPSGAVPT
jgi:hypothetical protein